MLRPVFPFRKGLIELGSDITAPFAPRESCVPEESQTRKSIEELEI